MDGSTHTIRGIHNQGQLVKAAAAAVAVAFILVGIAGFIPGLTTNVDNLEWAGHPDHGAAHPELLGLFHVSILHNLVHLAFGAGLLLARTARGAVTFLVGGGLIYIVVLIYGVAIDRDSDANFIPVNEADNWLHAGLATAMIALGVFLSPSSRSGSQENWTTRGAHRGADVS